MYAIVAHVGVENPDEARSLLSEAKDALVSQAPEIVSGYWLEPIAIEGLHVSVSLLVFETKEQAEKAVASAVPPMPGVTQLDVQVREVLAHS
jgi:hypothetical protein